MLRLGIVDEINIRTVFLPVGFILAGFFLFRS